MVAQQLAFQFSAPRPAARDLSGAWAFVAAHDRFIRSIARRFSRDPDVFAQDLRIYVAERHHRYDPDRSRPTTWIGYQALAVRKTHQRDAGRSTDRWEQIDDHEPAQAPDRLLAAVELSALSARDLDRIDRAVMLGIV